MKKIVFLCPHPYATSPSQRFRYEQYLAHLQQNGFETTVFPFLDLPTHEILYCEGHSLAKFTGVLAGYVTLFPHARVVTLIPIFIFIHFMEVPAWIFIVVWFGLQLVQGYLSLGLIGDGGGGVAWFAHIGGFLAGLVFVRAMVRRAKARPRRRAR